MPQPARRRHDGRRSTSARSGAWGIGLLLEQSLEQAPQLAVTSRLPTMVQVVGDIQLSCAALSDIGSAHVDVCPLMLDVETLAVRVEDEMPLVLVIQKGPSGGPVQLSFQQSHAAPRPVCRSEPVREKVELGETVVIPWRRCC